MHHVLTYQVSGIEFDTGRHYQTTTKVGIEKPEEAVHLINRWNRLSRSSTITYTVLHVTCATPEQQKQIDSTTHFPDGDIRRSFTLSEICKTEAASKVLKLLDGDEDAPGSYGDIIQLVAKELSITTKQLEAEVSPFI
jgi:hypothetical protein